jgi:hypothetical protein
LSDLINNVSAIDQMADRLAKALTEEQVLWNTLPVIVPGMVIGTGQFHREPGLLTKEQIKSIADDALRGNLVLVILYQDLNKAGSVVARCLGFDTDGATLRCVALGKDESLAKNTFLVRNPAKDVWCWVVYAKVIGA